MKKEEHRLSTDARAMRYIFRNHPVSRASLAEELSLSPAMVTNVVSHLLGEGLVRELGVLDDRGLAGRRRSLMGIEPGARTVVGVDLNQPVCSYCLTDLGGRMLAQRQAVVGMEPRPLQNREVIENIRALLKEPGAGRVAGVGIAVPGHYSPEREAVISHSMFAVEVRPQVIGQELGLPVACDNNVRAMAYEQYLFEREGCPESFAFIHTGGGIFCARFSEGKLAEDNGNITGEIGHMTVNPRGRRCGCGKYGCLQSYASETGILYKARLIYRTTHDTILRRMVSSEDDITLEMVVSAYELEDERMTSIIREAVQYLGMAVANVAIVAGPRKIFLHGRLMQNAGISRGLSDYVADQLRFVRDAFRQDIEVLPFSASRAAAGAAAMAADRLFIQRLS